MIARHGLCDSAVSICPQLERAQPMSATERLEAPTL